jgi:hypothetical protein
MSDTIRIKPEDLRKSPRKPELVGIRSRKAGPMKDKRKKRQKDKEQRELQERIEE